MQDPKFGSFAAAKGFAGLTESVGACFAVRQELVESKATVVAGLQGEAVAGVGARAAAVGSDFTDLLQQEGSFATLPSAFPAAIGKQSWN